MAADLQTPVSSLVGDTSLADRIDIARYVGGDVGEPTLRDIIRELKKPGRDPRASFEPPSFRDDVNTLDDLSPGMSLEGIITNVTNFGAFVDIGVHQDGLVHISQLADHFVDDPHKVAKAGAKLRVRVLEVDLERRRISLSARSGEGARGRDASASSREDPEGRRGDSSKPRASRSKPSGKAKTSGGGPRPNRGPRQNDGRGQNATATGFSNNPFARLLGDKK